MRKLPSKSFKLRFCVLLVITGLSFTSCKKDKKVQEPPALPDCGCDAKKAVDTIYYFNSSGNAIEGSLEYFAANTKPGWHIMQIIAPDRWTDYKVCNMDLQDLKKIIDTASKKYAIPVRFAGKLKDRCSPDTNWGEAINTGFEGGPTWSPEIRSYYISLDSIIKS